MVEAAINRPAARRGVSASLYALVGSIGLLALAGGILAVPGLRGGPEAAAHGHNAAPSHTAPRVTRSDDIGRVIRTGFGVIAVESVKKLSGLTAKQLAGVTHFPSYVAPDEMQVQVRVEMTNLQAHTVRYSPRQFRLVVGSGRPIRPTGSTLRDGTLQPSAAIDGQLTFVAPRLTRAGPRLWLELVEAEGRKPVRADLGPARTRGRIPATGPPGSHDHHDQQTSP